MEADRNDGTGFLFYFVLFYFILFLLFFFYSCKKYGAGGECGGGRGRRLSGFLGMLYGARNLRC